MRVLTLLLVLFSSENAHAQDSKLLVLFIGDSITAGKPTGQPQYKPSAAASALKADLAEGRYGYFEALVEATAAKDMPLRFRKIANGGQALTGWIGTTCLQVLDGRHREFKEKPTCLVVQDYYRVTDSTAADFEEKMRLVAAAAEKAKVRLVFSTVAVDPHGESGLKAKPEEVKETNDAILRIAADLKVSVIRIDQAWERYEAFAKDRTPAKDWGLTRRGSYADGVHPGTVGAFFQGLVVARELGIPAGNFDETSPALGVPKEQAAAIKALVYSWKEPTFLPTK